MIESEKHCTTLKKHFSETISSLEKEKQVFHQRLEEVTQSGSDKQNQLQHHKGHTRQLQQQIDQLHQDIESNQHYTDRKQQEAEQEIVQLKHQLDQVGTFLSVY